MDSTARFAASINFTAPRWLTLAGSSGVGKTHLARAVYRQFMEQNRFELKYDATRGRIYGNTAIYCDWRSACKQFAVFDLQDDLINEWFVVLDDIATENDRKGDVTAALERIIAGRKNKWTLITCNLSLQQIAERLDTRIASRMLRDNGEVIEVNVMDYALRNKTAA